jgi:hypothetical protein
MEPDKFETHIKSKLDAREITPSDAAWNKISKELKSEPSTKKPAYFWLGIAASVTVLLGVAIFYLNTGEKEMPTIQEFVETPAKQDAEPLEKNKLVISNSDSDEIAVQEVPERFSKKRETANSVDNSPQVGFEKQNQKDALVMELSQQESKASKLPVEPSEILLNEKIAEVVAQVALLEQSSQVSDAEVDSLLRNAQEAIFREQLFKQDQSVDAMALLTQVEEELDQSFRDQIFQSLKAGFIKVRTAVADRNN